MVSNTPRRLETLLAEVRLLILAALKEVHVGRQAQPPYLVEDFQDWSDLALDEADGLQRYTKDLFSLALTCKSLCDLVSERPYENFGVAAVDPTLSHLDFCWRSRRAYRYIATSKYRHLIKSLTHIPMLFEEGYFPSFSLPNCHSLTIRQREPCPISLEYFCNSKIRHLRIKAERVDPYQPRAMEAMLSIPEALESFHLHICCGTTEPLMLGTSFEKQKDSLQTLVLSRGNDVDALGNRYSRGRPINLKALSVLKHLCVFEADILQWNWDADGTNMLSSLPDVLPPSLESLAIHFPEPDVLGPPRGFNFSRLNQWGPIDDEWVFGWPIWLTDVVECKKDGSTPRLKSLWVTEACLRGFAPKQRQRDELAARDYLHFQDNLALDAELDAELCCYQQWDQFLTEFHEAEAHPARQGNEGGCVEGIAEAPAAQNTEKSEARYARGNLIPPPEIRDAFDGVAMTLKVTVNFGANIFDKGVELH